MINNNDLGSLIKPVLSGLKKLGTEIQVELSDISKLVDMIFSFKQYENLAQFVIAGVVFSVGILLPALVLSFQVIGWVSMVCFALSAYAETQKAQQEKYIQQAQSASIFSTLLFLPELLPIPVFLFLMVYKPQKPMIDKICKNLFLPFVTHASETLGHVAIKINRFFRPSPREQFFDGVRQFFGI